MLVFNIGHPSYTGANAPTVARSFVTALHVLLARGAELSAAAQALQDAISGNLGTVRVNGEVIEVTARAQLLPRTVPHREHGRFPCFVYDNTGDLIGGARNMQELEACQDSHPYDRLHLVAVDRERFAKQFDVPDE